MANKRIGTLSLWGIGLTARFFPLNCFIMTEPKYYLGENAFKVGTRKKNSQHLLCAIHCHSQKQIIELPDIIFTTIPWPGFYYLQVLVEWQEACNLFQIQRVTRGAWIWAGQSNERLTTPACASQGVPSLDGYPWLPAASGEKMVCSWQASQVVRVCQVHKST